MDSGIIEMPTGLDVIVPQEPGLPAGLADTTGLEFATGGIPTATDVAAFSPTPMDAFGAFYQDPTAVAAATPAVPQATSWWSSFFSKPAELGAAAASGIMAVLHSLTGGSSSPGVGPVTNHVGAMPSATSAGVQSPTGARALSIMGIPWWALLAGAAIIFLMTMRRR